MAEWRHDYANLALGGGNLLLMLLWLQTASRLGWQISFFGWADQFLGVAPPISNAIARGRHADLTHRIGTARVCRARPAAASNRPAKSCCSPVNGLPCLWYRYRIERRNGDKWEHVESGMSHDTFGVSDGSGQILIDPGRRRNHDLAPPGYE